MEMEEHIEWTAFDKLKTFQKKCDCVDKPDVFADVVSRFDFVHREFLMEEWMYKVELD